MQPPISHTPLGTCRAMSQLTLRFGCNAYAYQQKLCCRWDKGRTPGHVCKQACDTATPGQARSITVEWQHMRPHQTLVTENSIRAKFHLLQTKRVFEAVWLLQKGHEVQLCATQSHVTPARAPTGLCTLTDSMACMCAPAR